MSDEGGASWDRVSAHYLQNFGVAVGTRVHGRRQLDLWPRRRGERSVREALAKSRSTSTSARMRPRERHDVHHRRGHAKFAGWGLATARPCSYVPLAQTVNYAQDMLKRVKLQSS